MSRPKYFLPDGRRVELLESAENVMYVDALVPYTPCEARLAKQDKRVHTQVLRVDRLTER